MEKKENRPINKILLFIVVILIIMIILLLLRGCSKKDEGTNNKGNINVFELKCDVNCDCQDDKKDDNKKEDNPNTSGNNNSNSNSSTKKDNTKEVYKEIDDNNTEEENEVTIEVLDNDKTWKENIDIKLFEDSANVVKGKIAPESSGTYQFVIKNSTSFNVKYNIEFDETNSYNINMKYKLKKNNEYVVSDWVTYSALKQEAIRLNSKSSDTYYLEWKWFESSNDNSIGSNPSSKYGLSIDISAVQVND